MTNNRLLLSLSSVVLYRNVTQSPVLKYLTDYLRTLSSTDTEVKVSAYCDFVRELYNNGGDIGNYLEDSLRCDDNIYFRMAANDRTISKSMQKAFENELEIFTYLTSLTSGALTADIDTDVPLPSFDNTEYNFSLLIPDILSRASVTGYGAYARYTMFRVDTEDKNKILVPVPSPDKISMDDLIGYEFERNKVIDNTIALLEGKPAANALLCGDAGTGKSSTVKACVNMLRDRGLRLIEIKKDQLSYLPEVMGEIADNPLKFIIFIDDLSFAADDDSFGALKAVLEGSAAAKAGNAVIYATSNRRHIVKETFSSREGDDVHRNDSMQEMMSLSARFGLTVLFQKPDKKLYLTIVHALAEKKHITIPDTELDIKAEAFALSMGGRSARVAEQFTDSLLTAAVKQQ